MILNSILDNLKIQTVIANHASQVSEAAAPLQADVKAETPPLGASKRPAEDALLTPSHARKKYVCLESVSSICFGFSSCFERLLDV